MPKLNWEKLNKASKVQTDHEQTKFENSYKQDFHLFNETGLWSLKGKHYGKPVKQLTLPYMEWVLDNHKSAIHHQIIEKELRRRDRNLK
jgi:hypothetical protein